MPAPNSDALRGARGFMTGAWSDGDKLWVIDRHEAGGDITTLDSSGNRQPHGVWSDGATVWVSDTAARKVFAYARFGGTRRDSFDVSILSAAGQSGVVGIWSDGTHMWMIDQSHRRRPGRHQLAPRMDRRRRRLRRHRRLHIPDGLHRGRRRGRRLDLETPAQPAAFVDVIPGSTHAADVAAIAAAGVTVGCSAQPLLYCPDRPVTRAQMASFLARALDLS